LPDSPILEIAENPNKLNDFKKDWDVLRRHQEAIQELLNNPDSEYLDAKKYTFTPLTPAEKDRYRNLKDYLKIQANTLELDEGTLGNRKTFEKIARGTHDFLDKDNWRHRIFLNYLHSQDQ